MQRNGDQSVDGGEDDQGAAPVVVFDQQAGERQLPDDIGGMAREQLVELVAAGVRDAFAGGLAPDSG